MLWFWDYELKLRWMELQKKCAKIAEKYVKMYWKCAKFMYKKRWIFKFFNAFSSFQLIRCISLNKNALKRHWHLNPAKESVIKNKNSIDIFVTIEFSEELLSKYHDHSNCL